MTSKVTIEDPLADGADTKNGTSRSSSSSSSKKDKKESKSSKKEKKRDRHDNDDNKNDNNRHSSSKSRDKKRIKREVNALENNEHVEESKRTMSFDGSKQTNTTTVNNETTTNGNNNHDANNNNNSVRRRTRSFDSKEEIQVATAADKLLDVAEWRKEHSISIQTKGRVLTQDNDFAKPFREFTDTPFHNTILKSFATAGFERPTPIQSQSWPIALEKNDMICIAKTGSGKTCGFLLPYFHHFLTKYGLNHRRATTSGTPQQQQFGSNSFSNGPTTKPTLLVLAPTRELSVQIQEEAQKFGRPIGVRSLCVYGGSPKYAQIAALQRSGVEVLIATPGRLNDILEMKKVDLSQIETFVLDEADRMLDMGFEPQIRSIVKHIPTSRQTLLFSATWPKEIQKLANDFLCNPIQVNVGEVNALVANKDIEQTIVMLNNDDEKYDKLQSYLKEFTKDNTGGDTGSSTNHKNEVKQHEKIIIFVAKKVQCTELANRLWDEGYAVDSLHGDRQQWERTKVMNAFKLGTQLRMLIATDVAARGLDVKDVGIVFNYDMPFGTNAVEDYVHRIGRTGRAGAKGKAITFFTYGDKKCARQLVDVLTKSDQIIPPELQAMVPRSQRNGGGGGFQFGRGGGGGGGGRGRGYMGGGGGGGGGGGYRRGGGGRGGGGGRRY